MRELKKGSLGMLLLRLLSEQSSYGYELCERLRLRTEGALTFEDGAIYPLLHDFERRGVIEGYWGADEAALAPAAPATVYDMTPATATPATTTEAAEPVASAAQRKGPRRRYYRLTTEGRATLRASIEEWQAFSQAVQRVLGEGAVESANGQ